MPANQLITNVLSSKYYFKKSSGSANSSSLTTCITNNAPSQPWVMTKSEKLENWLYVECMKLC